MILQLRMMVTLWNDMQREQLSVLDADPDAKRELSGNIVREAPMTDADRARMGRLLYVAEHGGLLNDLLTDLEYRFNCARNDAADKQMRPVVHEASDALEAMLDGEGLQWARSVAAALGDDVRRNPVPAK